MNLSTRVGLTMMLIASSLSLGLAAETLPQLEKSLRDTYQGKNVRLQPPPVGLGRKLKLSEQLEAALQPGIATHFRLEDLALKKKELRMRARPVYVFQDIQGQFRQATGPSWEFSLRWKRSPVDPTELRAGLSQLLILDDPAPAPDPRHWPPPGLELPQQQSTPSSRPSREVGPAVFTIGSDVVPPKCIRCDNPEFPEEARRAGMKEGYVANWVVVTETGRIAGIRAIQISGHGFSEAAVSAISNWAMKPAVRNGQPVRVVMWVETEFHRY